MKVLLYHGGIGIVRKSGLGRAYEHQKKALHLNHIQFTTNSRKKYDIAQFNTIFPDSMILAYLLKRKGKKIVYYAHSTMEDFRKSFIGSDLLAPLFKKWLILCYNRGDVIITPTEYSKKLLRSYGIEKPIYSISNGIDLEFYNRNKGDRKKFREKFGFTENDKVIMSVGHYIERKGILDFVELAKRMPEYKFIWFGYTNLHIVPIKVKKAIYNRTSNVILPGYVDKNEIRDAYAGSDLFLFLTYEETEGIVLLESLAMKNPTVIRDIPIYDELFTEGIAIYKGSNIKEFMNIVKRILKGEVHDLTKNGYELIKERDLRKTGKEVKDIYKMILEE